MTTNLERYCFYAKAVESTPLYREWSFYSLIGSCLQRRYWTMDDENWPLYGNHFLIFVGLPGTGKTNCTLINLKILHKLNEWYQLKTGKCEDPDKPFAHELIHVCPQSVTVEQLIYRMGLISDAFLDSNQKLHCQSAVTFNTDEIGTLFDNSDSILTDFLKTAWDCGPKFVRETKHQGYDTIHKPCINLLAGTTPTWIQKGIRYGILEDGFLGRALFVSGGYPDKRIAIFRATKEQQEAIDLVIEHCKSLMNGKGGFVPFSKEAEEYLKNWYETGFKIINPDPILVHYYARKKALACKQSLINYFSEPITSPTISIEHFKKALESLERVEIDMHMALASIGRNPIHALATKLFEYLKQRGTPAIPDLLVVRFHADGSEDEIRQAISYLEKSMKIVGILDPKNNNQYSVKINLEYH